MSALRCKPGDLAIVVVGAPRENIGRVIRCLEISEFATTICGCAMWAYEGKLVGHLGNRSSAVQDDCLKPIRDPGDDAVDEMVAKLGPAPMTLTEVREVSHG